MNSEYQPQFEKDLAGATKPGDIENTEPPNDPAKSLRIGLSKLYLDNSREIKRLHKGNLINDKKADELTARIDELSARDLGYEISKGLPLEMAKEIMGPLSFFGPEEITFAGIEIREEIPPIQLSMEELEKAKELGQMLIYRTDTTLKELNETDVQYSKFSKFLFNPEIFNEDEFYSSQRTQPGWALVSKKYIPNSSDKNYLEQSELLVEYLVNEVFQGNTLPPEYQSAIDELNDQKQALAKLMVSQYRGDHQQAAERLTNLRINKLFRQTPAEVIFDSKVYFHNSGTTLLIGTVWTSACSFLKTIVFVGPVTSTGSFIGLNAHPHNRYSQLRTTFARRL